MSLEASKAIKAETLEPGKQCVARSQLKAHKIKLSSIPAFLKITVICLQDGKMIDIVKGANGPLLNKKVAEIIEQERKIIAGVMTRPEVMLLSLTTSNFIK